MDGDYILFIVDEDFDGDPESLELRRMAKRSGLRIKICRVNDSDLPSIQHKFGISLFPAFYDTTKKISYQGFKMVELAIWSRMNKKRKALFAFEDIICYIIYKLSSEKVTTTKGVIFKLLFALSLHSKLPIIPSIDMYGPYSVDAEKAIANLEKLEIIDEYLRKRRKAYRPLISEEEARILRNRIRKFIIETRELDKLIEHHKGWSKERISLLGMKLLKPLFKKMSEVPWIIDIKRAAEHVPIEMIEESGVSIKAVVKILGEGEILAYKRVYFRERIKQKLLERCRKMIKDKEKGKNVSPWRYRIERLLKEIGSGRNVQGEDVFLIGFPCSFFKDEGGEDLHILLTDSFEGRSLQVRMARASPEELMGYIVAVIGYVEGDYIRALAIVKLNYAPEWFKVN